ncbi:related to Structural maintenance of chromosomes protein 6 [Saccharomycodes ludwigii]|uniref:Related to Structural maintenance of chromosomes protein 6 n=1 Tax=Saccharomycodes ludwigii TaxID=36035 RepID=A0A376B1N1_9ASCO|nr:related to Structural maintenance of chromosomes protein 6 [Saccharomycodes ludwigii]
MSKRSIDEVNELNKTVQSLAAVEDEANQLPNKRVKKRYEFAMTQYESAAQDSVNDPKTFTPPGYIKKVILKNFMCHENFELEFGPRLNFIIGNNGSGKSAILTAITVCLGAKATTTNRGTSLKDLIKADCNTCKIIIVLSNEGLGGFRQDIYGNSIIIERTFKRDSSSNQYKLKTENGREVSSKKRELDEIVDYFSIPIMNPMCFLSQDAARSFLTASTPRDKYSHFMRGTLLEETANNLRTTISTIKSVEATIHLHNQNVKELYKEYKEAQALLSTINSSATLNERKRILQGKIYWLNVVENEKHLNELQSLSSKCNEKIMSMEQKENNLTYNMTRLKVDLEDLSKQLQPHYDVMASRQEIFTETKLKLSEALSEIESKNREKIETTKTITSHKNLASTLKSTIKSLEEQLQKNTDEKQQTVHNELEKIRNTQRGIDELMNKYSVEIGEFNDNKIQLQENKQREKETLLQSINENQRQLKKIASGNNNLISAFDNNMHRVLADIEKLNQQGKFKQKPIGPLGLHVTIKESFQRDWARPIQKLLDSTLKSFVVSNQDDRRLLNDISRRNKVNIGIITRKMDIFDYSDGKAVSEYPTIADALSFSEKSIECTFVDMNKIETVVLISDRNKAKSFLEDHPSNVRQVLSIRDHKSGLVSSINVYNAFKIDTIYYSQRPLAMRTSTTNGEASYFRELIEEDKKRLGDLANKFDVKIENCAQKIREHKREMKKLNDEATALKNKATALEVDLERVVDTNELERSKADLETQERSIAVAEQAVTYLDTEILKLTEANEPLKRDYVEAKEALTTAQEEYNTIRQEINDKQGYVDTIIDKISRYKEKRAVYCQKKGELLNDTKKAESYITQTATAAAEYCTRDQAFADDVPNTNTDVEFELSRIDKQIRDAEKSIGMSQEEVLQFYDEAKSMFQEASNKIKDIRNAIDLLSKSVARRTDALEYAKKDTCLAADTDFKASLRFRNFTGGLVFDFSTETLNMMVKTPNDESARNVDSLSGGEKSFSQISLLLATWKPMRSRIIALDEFDVFMDQVNRTIGTKLIMEKLSSDNRTQTIIITPQDIGKIANLNGNSDDIRIHKMPDPQRHNNSTFYDKN